MWLYVSNPICVNLYTTSKQQVDLESVWVSKQIVTKHPFPLMEFLCFDMQIYSQSHTHTQKSSLYNIIILHNRHYAALHWLSIDLKYGVFGKHFDNLWFFSTHPSINITLYLHIYIHIPVHVLVHLHLRFTPITINAATLPSLLKTTRLIEIKHKEHSHC